MITTQGEEDDRSLGDSAGGSTGVEFLGIEQREYNHQDPPHAPAHSSGYPNHDLTGSVPRRPPPSSPVEHRVYVGLSSSWARDALAIVDSRGEIVFAEESESFLSGRDLWSVALDSSENLIGPLERYCETDSRVVISLPVLTDVTRGSVGILEDDRAYFGSGRAERGPGGSCQNRLRSTARMPSYAKLRELSMLSRLVDAVERHVRRQRNGAELRPVVRYYDRRLSQAAAACFSGPARDALCAVLDVFKRQGCAYYIYKDGMLFEINPAFRLNAGRNLARVYHGVCDARGFQWTCGEHSKVVRLEAHLNVCESMNGQESTDRSDIHLTEGQGVVTTASTEQAAFEEQLYSLLRNLYTMGNSDNLVFTGACALNSVVNGKVLANTDFKTLYVPYAPYYSGKAVGAALLAYHQDSGRPIGKPRSTIQPPYLGSELSSKELLKRLDGKSAYEAKRCDGDAPERAAGLLARGMVIAWIQGRAEFAPRALGNRSILADPRREDIRIRLKSLRVYEENNASPRLAVLHEYGSDWFEHYQESPYMERALRLRLKTARRIPAVINFDGTAQVQTVKRDWNGRFYDLILSFYRITGIPLLVNMSCGVPGGGFIRTVEDLLMVFSKREIDALFIEDLSLCKCPQDSTTDVQ